MQSSCVPGEHSASGLSRRGTGWRSQRRGCWEEGPHLPLLLQSASGLSLPSQETHDLTEPFVPLPVHADVLGNWDPCLQNLPAPNTPGWELSSGSVLLLPSLPLGLCPREDLDDPFN